MNRAEATVEADRATILNEIRNEQGSLEVFNSKLKVALVRVIFYFLNDFEVNLAD